MMWAIVKNWAGDIWEEMFYLIVFNFIWLVGTALILPWPLVTFGLYFTVYDIGEGKGIKLSTFFKHARQTWKQAYLWGGINLGLLIIWWVNLDFYSRLGTEWAALAQMFTVALAIFWIVLQLAALAFYPRLVNPGFKVAEQNALIAIGRYPHFTLILLVIIALVIAATLFFQILLLFGSFALIAVAANRLVDAVVRKERMRRNEAAKS
jgi:uncharacterized membrane protein YesL